MNFLRYDLGQLKKGQIVEISLSSQANVKLMTSSDFNNYKNGRKHRYYGGLAKVSPIRIPVPSNNHWYVTVDLGGYAGKVNASVNVLPGLLQPIRQLNNTPMPTSLFLGNNPPVTSEISTAGYDVFISHASEDKDQVARPLAEALRIRGLSVWYDEFELKIGDSLRRKIDQGLAHSNFGIIIISRNFINKGWTNYELDGLITRALTGEQQILPIWHDITKQEVINFSPSLADKLARNTAVNTVEEIADEIADLINASKGV